MRVSYVCERMQLLWRFDSKVTLDALNSMIMTLKVEFFFKEMYNPTHFCTPLSRIIAGLHIHKKQSRMKHCFLFAMEVRLWIS